ncbi:MAG: hypothetical protein QOH27_4977 [Mycobacterium sp.]|nr:hypothetical protein [Mycobacterium sp.]
MKRTPGVPHRVWHVAVGRRLRCPLRRGRRRDRDPHCPRVGRQGDGHTGHRSSSRGNVTGDLLLPKGVAGTASTRTSGQREPITALRRYARGYTTYGPLTSSPARPKRRACGDLPPSAAGRSGRRRFGWARRSFHLRRCRTITTTATPRQRSMCGRQPRVRIPRRSRGGSHRHDAWRLRLRPAVCSAPRRESGPGSPRRDRYRAQHAGGDRDQSSWAIRTLRRARRTDRLIAHG